MIKKFFLMLFTLLLFIPNNVFAEDRLFVDVEVKSNDPSATIVISGTDYMPENSKLTGEGTFILTFPQAQPGDVYTYTIRQESVSKNFLMDDTVYTLSVYILIDKDLVYAVGVINEGDVEKPAKCLFNNTPKTFTVDVIKKDIDTGELLEGAEISLFDSEDNLLGSKLTDKNGEATLNFIPEEGKTYYVQETKAPTGYKLVKTKFYVNFTQFNPVITILNEKIKVDPPPKTGDESNVTLWLSIGGISLCLLIALVISLKRERKQDE